MVSGGSIYAGCAPAESLDQSIGDVVEHRSYRERQQLARKFIVQLQLYLACVLAQRDETPIAVQALEGPAHQAYFDLLRRLLGIFGSEALLDPVIIYLQGSAG